MLSLESRLKYMAKIKKVEKAFDTLKAVIIELIEPGIWLIVLWFIAHMIFVGYVQLFKPLSLNATLQLNHADATLICGSNADSGSYDFRLIYLGITHASMTADSADRVSFAKPVLYCKSFHRDGRDISSNLALTWEILQKIPSLKTVAVPDTILEGVNKDPLSAFNLIYRSNAPKLSLDLSSNFKEMFSNAHYNDVNFNQKIPQISNNVNSHAYIGEPIVAFPKCTTPIVLHASIQLKNGALLVSVDQNITSQIDYNNYKKAMTTALDCIATHTQEINQGLQNLIDQEKNDSQKQAAVEQSWEN